MLKELFSSNTRIKLLKIFLFNTDKEFFIRELTRKLDEQINSIRRELTNLKKIGLLKSRSRNRKKYYHVNTDFAIFHELKSIFMKSMNNEMNISKAIANIGSIDLLVFSGIFVSRPEAQVDLFIVGDLSKQDLEKYLITDLNRNDIRYSILSKDDFLYRLSLNDRFIVEILGDSNNIIAINKLKKQIQKV